MLGMLGWGWRGVSGLAFVSPAHARRDQCKTLSLDDQGGIKGGLDRVWRVGNRESLLRCAARASLAADKREVLEVLQWSLLVRGRPLRLVV